MAQTSDPGGRAGGETVRGLPSVAILRDDRAEARSLADELAVMLDEFIHHTCLGEPADPDELYAANALMQEWHERTWAPE